MSDPFQNAFLTERFWRSVESHMFNVDRWARAATEVEDIICMAKPAIAFPVLDVGCGPGRHAKSFASLGYRVLGIDVVESYVAAARKACLSFGDRTEFVRCDAMDFVSPPRFGLAVSLFNSLGYRDQASDARTLQNISAALQPSGSLVISIMTWEIAMRRFRARSEHRYDGGILHRNSEMLGASRQLVQEWKFVEGTKTHSYKSRQYLYSAEELRSTVEGAGFSCLSLAGDLSGNAYGSDSELLVLLARKLSA